MTDVPPDKPWPSLQEGVRYEVAQDLFGHLIGQCSAKLAEERHKETPDPAELQRWTSQATQYAAERAALDPRDQEAVEAVIAKYGPVVRGLRSGGDNSGS
ncbi:hypothetical protein [Kribbella catacumbae]|uniref:hypothetical protein n=1 Tax=Kribbella catacumbae TaxID=460086 RepID=UPI0003660DC2|nr:hypothetical protein [Kribbella catacumbae]